MCRHPGNLPQAVLQKIYRPSDILTHASQGIRVGTADAALGVKMDDVVFPGKDGGYEYHCFRKKQDELCVARLSDTFGV